MFLQTLFPKTFNWFVYIITIIIFKFVFINMSWTSYFVAVFSIYQFTLLFDQIGKIIPTRHLLCCFMCVQFFIGPMFAYNGLDDYQYFMYKMRIPEWEYFSYAIPAVLLFILGLHIRAGDDNGEKINLNNINEFVEKNKMLPYALIVLGFLSSVLSIFFSSSLSFVFYLLGGFKFIGLFMLILGEKKIKILPLVIVISSIVSSSFGSGMFHDLLIWIIYIGTILAIKFNFGLKEKLIGLILFVLLATIIQVLKANFRSLKTENNEDIGLQAFLKLYEKQNEEKGIFNFTNLAASNVRINQGFIITNIMTNVPDRVDFARGSELYKLLEAAFLPRIIAPNKLNAGDRALFTKYSGIPLSIGTSMGLSSVGDGYINFGIFGGCVFMFVLGLFYSEVLNTFHKYRNIYPSLLLFVPLVFYYPIRPDCELQTILGHLVKSCFLIFVMIQLWKHQFRINRA